MRGSIVAFDAEAGSGSIDGEDGRRYEFTASGWQAGRLPARGELVEFAPDGHSASDVRPLATEYREAGFAAFYLSPAGRVSRAQYWLRYVLPVVVIGFSLSGLSAIAAAGGHGAVATALDVAYYVFMLAAIWPGAAVLAKRIHDRNKTGWLVLVPAVPVGLMVAAGVAGAAADSASTIGVAVGVLAVAVIAVGIWFFVEFGCLRGTVGVNRYGPDPVRSG